MTLDGLTLHAVTQELNDRLHNAKIQKVLMPGKEELILQMYSAAEGTMRVVLSANAGECAVYITEHTKPNPKNAPVFCMFLRKHLVGAVVRRVEQSGLDRVVTFHLESRDDLFRPVLLRLVIEVMGKYSNIILTDEGGRILDSIRRVSADMSRRRTVLPGIPYEPPPQHKQDPLALSEAEIEHVLRASAADGDPRADRLLISSLDGVSAQTAEELLGRARIDRRPVSQLDAREWHALAAVVHDFYHSATKHPAPCVQLNDESIPVFFSLVPYRAYPSQSRRSFSSANSMLDFFYTTRSELARVAQARSSLQRIVEKHLQKLSRRIRIYEESIQASANTHSMQKKAELITANLYRLKKGMPEFTAQDFETGEEIHIQLDPSRTPSEMAQKMYRHVAKVKRGAEMSAEKLIDAREEEDFLLGVLLYTENASTLREIGEIKESLAEAGYMPTARKNAKKNEDADSVPFRFTSPSGYTIYVGRNDRQNEQLTHRMARKEDIWFHAQKTPGSHVILETRGASLDDIDDETIVFAAQLAAKHSRAKGSGKTPVDYTQRRNVKKPPRSRPGKVIYDDYFTVYVDASAPAQADDPKPR